MFGNENLKFVQRRFSVCVSLGLSPAGFECRVFFYFNHGKWSFRFIPEAGRQEYHLIMFPPTPSPEHFTGMVNVLVEEMQIDWEQSDWDDH